MQAVFLRMELSFMYVCHIDLKIAIYSFTYTKYVQVSNILDLHPVNYGRH